MPNVRKALDRRQFLGWGVTTASGLWAASRLPAWAQPAKSDHPRSIEKELIVHQRVPHNAEPALDDLVQSWITPLSSFYVRSHAPVPEIDAAEFQVSVEGLVERPYRFTLADLQRNYDKRSVVATLTCAGNRRKEHSAKKPVSGVPWDAGAIGNAQWGGVPLARLLQTARLKSDARHVWFESVDKVERPDGVIPFGASIPIDKAMSDGASMPGAMVVYEMNGKRLLPDHGFPLRTVVPGYIGARSVKWLGKIIVSDVPSPNHYVAGAYKLVEEGTPQEWAEAEPIENYKLNSVICIPASGREIHDGQVNVAGYALPPGLASYTIKRVELSADEGRTWIAANFTSRSQAFCWRLWQVDVPVTPQTKALWVRAVDSKGNLQPPHVPWNLKGYLYNAWHKVPLAVKENR